MRSNALAALENIPLWHERDISHSSVERVILPDSTTLAHYLTVRLNEVIQNLEVHEEQMEANLRLTRGLIFSGTLLLELVKIGVLREEAYGWIQRNAMRVWAEDNDFKTLILEDPDIQKHLTQKEVKQVFKVQNTLKHMDAIFERVFGSS